MSFSIREKISHKTKVFTPTAYLSDESLIAQIAAKKKIVSTNEGIYPHSVNLSFNCKSKWRNKITSEEIINYRLFNICP